jgi:hypothetical protein
MRRKRSVWLVVAIALLVVGFYLWGSSRTPSGQPALVLLSQSNVVEFQESFNAANEYTRVVLLVSPT